MKNLDEVWKGKYIFLVLITKPFSCIFPSHGKCKYPHHEDEDNIEICNKLNE